MHTPRPSAYLGPGGLPGCRPLPWQAGADTHFTNADLSLDWPDVTHSVNVGTEVRILLGFATAPALASCVP